MRLTVGIGYWKASSQDLKTFGSGASAIIAVILGVVSE